MTAVASCDASGGTNVSLDQKSHVAPYFDCFDLSNAMAQLMIPLASCDTSASASGIM